MHIEILVEDQSGAYLLESLLPQVIGPNGHPHTWRLHNYRGIGRIPQNLAPNTNPTQRMLLTKLPSLLRGYGRTPGVDAVVVVVDADNRNCAEFLTELKAVEAACNPAPKTLFRLAIEEIEAWYFGDQTALLAAYPRAKKDVLKRYAQDSICGTWETLADAIHVGGSMAIKKAGWPLPGQMKCEWAKAIGPKMQPHINKSPSFIKFRDGLYTLVSS